jgi:MFS family permease
LTAHHVVWRDEVRALTYALQGNDVLAMLRALHGEGHPALWYLLLRAAHALVPVPQVLVAVALVIAAAAMWLLVFRSPFSIPVIALLLASHFAAYEYSVMARNYGISMLLMFLFAALYQRWRNRGWLLGVLLFLLANTNTYSVLLVAAFLLFWFLETLSATGLRWSRQLKLFWLNALLAGAGVLLCWLTVHPLLNDAAIVDHAGGLSATKIFKDIIFPATGFEALFVHPFEYLPLDRIGPTGNILLQFVLSMLLFGATLGLRPRPAALVAAVSALVVISVFFDTVAPGTYRHQALWLVFLVSLYWIEGLETSSQTSANSSVTGRWAANLGSIIFMILLVAQLPSTVARMAHPGDESRSADFANWMTASSQLRDAIIIADPDFLVETVPYFLSNSTYLMREDRFGHIPVFTRKARLHLSLAQVLAIARALHASSNRPIVILLQQQISISQPDTTYSEAYGWEFMVTTSMASDFLANTRHLASFPRLRGDEAFDVYTLK